MCVSTYLCALPLPLSAVAPEARPLFVVSIAAAYNGTQIISGVHLMKKKMEKNHTLCLFPPRRHVSFLLPYLQAQCSLF